MGEVNSKSQNIKDSNDSLDMKTEKTKNIGYIIASKTLAFFVGIVRGLFVPGYLGPQLYGVIGLLKLVRIVLGFGSFGMDQAYFRLSIEHKDRDLEKKKALEDNVFTFLLVSAIIGAVVTFALPFIVKGHTDLHKLMIFCFGITAIQHFFQLTGNFFFQSVYIEKRFKVISAMNILQPLIALTLILSTVFKWKIYAVFIADLISVAVVQLWYFKAANIKPQFKIHWNEFKQTFKYAIPFFLAMICFYLFRFTDRTVIASFLTLEDLGLYTFAIGIAESTRLLCVSINEVSSPFVVEEISKADEISSISEKIQTFTYKLVFISTFISLLSIFLSPFITVILPKYSPALIVLIILLINNFMRTFQLYQIMILSSPRVNRQNHINIAMGITGVFNVILSICLVRRGFGITGVVFATFLSNIVMASFYFIASQKYYLTSGKTKYYGKIIFALTILLAFAVLQRMDSMVSVKNFMFDTVTFMILGSVLIAVYRKQMSDLIERLVQVVKR